MPNPIPMVSRYSAQAGEVVNKAGATTGWTQGTVTATCKDVEYTVSPIIFGLVIKCQHEANYARAGGDSGAPVYRLVGGGADLKGIHWARYLQVTGYKVVFSPLSGIEDDFGPLGGLPSGGPGSTPPDPSCNPIIAIEPCG